jgi:hypothetical protein
MCCSTRHQCHGAVTGLDAPSAGDPGEQAWIYDPTFSPGAGAGTDRAFEGAV